MQDLGGKTALVTGGSRGIGRAICLELAARGARVAVNYRSRSAEAEATAAAVRDLGVSALTIQSDISRRSEVGAMAKQVEDELGAPDILVNNAGLLHRGELLAYSEDEFDRMWRTNVKGVLYCSEAVAPAMIRRGWGRIVNLASNAAIGTAMAGTTLYAVTKGAVLTLTKRMAFELSPKGITVNAVLPGFTKTDMVMSGKSQDELDRLLESVAERSLVGRTGEPEDIAHLTGFLCSPASGFITGQFMLADGGRKDYLTRV
ncbi:MAG: glucose 1-dehydrogenase [Bryobacterales bacterium]|nr:glucose 1-dehydrogenase [Bryobacterales bacterium]MDE0261052.1 glucose 1-dehydrogenase [Bryobacterales bacterium]MDE0621817.1 glucose 1-dehydrogenase [Bryobacterales bacterium]